MKDNIYKKRIMLTLLLPIGMLLNLFFMFYPMATERVYSSTVYRFFAQMLSSITGILPFSLGELLVLGVLLFIPLSFIRFIVLLIKERKNRRVRFFRFTAGGTAFAATLYFLFVVAWGINYHRQPLSNILGLATEPASIAELGELCSNLIDQANLLREKTKEAPKGYMLLEDSKNSTLKRAQAAYKAASPSMPVISGTYGKAKGVMLSEAMCYLGISGIYFPFTFEANVNMKIPDVLFPATTCHEMAHQRGLAREDEANYIAYYVSVRHPDVDFQYSGTFLALIYSLNALRGHNPQLHSELIARCSPKVIADFRYLSEFWKRYEGPADKIQDRINDAYLKANAQEDGIHSYGRMVDLLLAEYKLQN